MYTLTEVYFSLMLWISMEVFFLIFFFTIGKVEDSLANTGI